MVRIGPVAHIIGLLVAALGVTMLPGALIDLTDGNANWQPMMEAAGVTVTAGLLLALAGQREAARALDIRQAFLLTTGAWSILPLFGGLPFVLGAPRVEFVDAYFEAMSGLTTTGTTVFVGLDEMPRGMLFWRGLLQWLGGLGIVIVAMIFLPVMRVGGMQFFRSEGFDTLGKILPRAFEISRQLLGIYVGLTLLCAAVYAASGMTGFEAIVHALTTLSTGGFSTTDLSFGAFKGVTEYVSAVFMFAASLPFIRFLQLLRGEPAPLLQDVQARAYLRWTLYAIAAITIYRVAFHGAALEPAFREAVFNVVSAFSGTGYTSEDLHAWGAFPLSLLLVVGLVGGCTSSTACSIKIFRWLVVIETVRHQVRRLRSPNLVVPLRLGDQPLEQEVVNSVMVFMTSFFACFGMLIVALEFTGLEIETAVTAAWTAIANVGPAFGPEVGPSGAVDAFPEAAKWLMILGMLLGRLELVAVLALFLPRFWAWR